MSLFPVTASLPQSGSVVARYLLDEASGNAIAETGGLDLTDNGSVGAGTGFTAPGANFDNSRDFIPNDDFSRGDNTVFDLLSDFTISVLFNPDDLGATSAIVAKWTGASDRSYQIFQRSDGKWTFEVTSGGSSATADAVLSTDVLSGTGTFFLLTAVYEASTRMELYVDGVPAGTNTTSINSSVFNSVGAFRIGSAGAANYANAQMNDAIIWKGAALADSEVIALFNLYQTAPVIGGHTYFM